MILADTLADQLRATTNRDAQALLASMGDAARFVFDDKTSALAVGAVMRPADVARAIPLPAAVSWLELSIPGERVGILFRTEGEAMRQARCIVARKLASEPALRISTAMIDMDGGGFDGLASYIGDAFIGAIAMLATPALCNKRPVNLEKLNKSRARSGKPPLFSHEMMTIDLGKTSLGNQNGTIGDGHTRPHHFCRAFLRFRLGKMEMVRPHWRGNATVGVRAPNFRVTA